MIKYSSVRQSMAFKVNIFVCDCRSGMHLRFLALNIIYSKQQAMIRMVAGIASYVLYPLCSCHSKLITFEKVKPPLIGHSLNQTK